MSTESEFVVVAAHNQVCRWRTLQPDRLARLRAVGGTDLPQSSQLSRSVLLSTSYLRPEVSNCWPTSNKMVYWDTLVKPPYIMADLGSGLSRFIYIYIRGALWERAINHFIEKQWFLMVFEKVFKSRKNKAYVWHSHFIYKLYQILRLWTYEI